MVSLKQIAQKCGVSVATVSKALNDHKDIGKATKERIRQVASELDYFPNAAARTLKTNRSYNLGVLFADASKSGLTHDYFSAVLESFKLEAEARGYDITFINTHLGERSYVEKCRNRSMDGVVIACIDFTRPEVVELMRSSIPIVTIDFHYPSCNSVLSDNAKGMEALTQHIIHMGHTRVAYIHGESNSSVTKCRLDAFLNTLQRFSISLCPEYILSSKYLDLRSAALCTEQLLSLSSPPSCILYPDDTALLGGLNVIREQGLHIPEDISIAGYDGLKVSRYITPKLTTVRQNTGEIGSRAASLLIQQIERPDITVVEHSIVHGTLIIGESVGKKRDTN